MTDEISYFIYFVICDFFHERNCPFYLLTKTRVMPKIPQLYKSNKDEYNKRITVYIRFFYSSILFPILSNESDKKMKAFKRIINCLIFILYRLNCFNMGNELHKFVIIYSTNSFLQTKFFSSRIASF